MWSIHPAQVRPSCSSPRCRRLNPGLHHHRSRHARTGAPHQRRRRAARPRQLPLLWRSDQAAPNRPPAHGYMRAEKPAEAFRPVHRLTLSAALLCTALALARHKRLLMPAAEARGKAAPSPQPRPRRREAVERHRPIGSAASSSKSAANQVWRRACARPTRRSRARTTGHRRIPFPALPCELGIAGGTDQGRRRRVISTSRARASATVCPVQTRGTGAVRLEDPQDGAVWIPARQQVHADGPEAAAADWRTNARQSRPGGGGRDPEEPPARPAAGRQVRTDQSLFYSKP